MSDVLRSTTFQLEFKGQDGITGVRQFTKAVTDADAVVDKLSETLGDNVDVTVKNISSKAELTAEAKRLVNQMQKTNTRVAEMTNLYNLQISSIGKTANEMEVLNAVYRLGANATQEQKNQVTTLVQNYQRMRDETDRTQGSFRNLRGISQQLGWQIQDVAVQAQMGTSAFVIIGQQGSQLAAAFGPTGALVGAFIAVASVIAGTFVNSLTTAGDKIDLLTAKTNELTKSQRELSKIKVSEEMEKTNSEMAQLAQRIATLNNFQKSNNGLTEGQTKDLLELKSAYETGSENLTKYSDRLKELNGAPSKDTVKMFTSMTDGINKNIIALREGEKAAALYSAQQEIMKNAKENKLSDDVVKQQIADVTALINEEYRLKAAKEDAKKSEQAAKKDRSAEQAVLKAQESEFDSLRKSMEKSTNTIREEYDRRKTIIDRHVATVGSVDTEAAQAYGDLEEWKTNKVKEENDKQIEAYQKREDARRAIEQGQAGLPGRDDTSGLAKENAKFIANQQVLKNQQTQVESDLSLHLQRLKTERDSDLISKDLYDSEIAKAGNDAKTEQERINSLIEGEEDRHNKAMSDLRLAQITAQIQAVSDASMTMSSIVDLMSTGIEDVKEKTKEMNAFQKGMFIINQSMAAAMAVINGISLGTKLAEAFPLAAPEMIALGTGLGAAQAGAIMATTFVGTFDNGGVIPAGSTGIVSEYGDELVNGQLVKGPARVTSREDTAKLMNNGGTSLKVVVDNKISGASYSVQQVDESTVKLIAEQVFSNNIDSGVSGVLSNRNSKSTKAMKNKFTVRSKF